MAFCVQFLDNNTEQAALLAEATHGQCGVGVGGVEIEEFLRETELTRIVASSPKADENERPALLGSPQRLAFVERELRLAAKNGEGFNLLYQPQVEMTTGEVVGAEALLRWRHGGDLISPVEFIPVAEASGLIVDIGGWVLREACAEAARWKPLGLGNGQGIKVSVNLSVKQLSDSLPSQIHGLLYDTGLSADLLGLEITETLLAGDVCLSVLDTLRNSGLHLSIDDFGTGYSCLSSIAALPLNTIKIDRSFVIGLGLDARATAVVEAIVSLATKLGMSTIAEGVETALQASILTELGCTVAQGYLFAKPMSAAEFVQFAAARGFH